MSNTKISIIGAGNVGAQAAMCILERDLADIVLLDIQEDLARAKALDMTDAGAILGFKSRITGTADYANIKDSEIVAITAGFTRKPGMNRDALLGKNASVVKGVVLEIKKYCPRAIIIVVTNPLDILTYLALKISELSPNRVIGMAGVLDAARFSVQVSELSKIPSGEIKSVILGSHSDKMLILPRFSGYGNNKIEKLLKSEQLELAKQNTRVRGAEIVNLLKGGSAFFAPSAGILKMVEAIIQDKKEVMPVCAYLDGQYGLKDITLGTLAKIGRDGVEEIIELSLTSEEKEVLYQTAKEMQISLKELNLI
jgi:malate dehydrogenase